MNSNQMRSKIVLFVGCWVVYMINGRPHPEVDCIAAPYVAWSLIQDGSYELQRYGYLEKYVSADGPLLRRSDGAWISMRPPGSALATLPAILPLALILDDPPSEGTMNHLGKAAAAVYVSFSVVFLFATIQRLAPVAAWPTAVLFAFGTTLWSVASQAIWMHGPAVFGLTVGLFLVAGLSDLKAGHLFLSGLAIGFAVLTRPTTALFGLATISVLTFRGNWRNVLVYALGGVLPALVFIHYQWANFGTFLGGYKDNPWDRPTPLWIGLTGLLFAPSRGLFVYSPALVLSLFGLVAMVGRGWDPRIKHRDMLWGWVAASFATLIFFGQWHDWVGGWCYGPRVLSEILPVLCLLFGFTYSRLVTGTLRLLAHGLIGLSILVHAVGVFGYSGYVAWQERHPLIDHGRLFFSIHDTQIEAHFRALLRKGMRLFYPQGEHRAVGPRTRASQKSKQRPSINKQRSTIMERYVWDEFEIISNGRTFGPNGFWVDTNPGLRPGLGKQRAVGPRTRAQSPGPKGTPFA